MSRILFGCFEVPGWGGLTTATYRLFETMLADGLDVHYLNLILAEEVPRFRAILGDQCENPRLLPNVHSCHLAAELHEPQPGLSATIERLNPDLMVGVGDIATYLLKRAAPRQPVTFLTAGCMQVDRSRPVTEQGIGANGSSPSPGPDWKEAEAVAMSELIVTHSPLTRACFVHFYPGHSARIHPSVIWFADWIRQDAAEYLAEARPFAERDIDALFVASSWARPEKNYQLVTDIASRLPDLSLHIVGEVPERIPSVTHHGFVSTRADLFRIMGRARTVVSPSLFDAAPGILFEGSTLGCNVVTSRNCGNWELCNERLLVTEYTADAFADAIRIARQDKLPDHMDHFLAQGSYGALKEILRSGSDTNLGRRSDQLSKAP